MGILLLACVGIGGLLGLAYHSFSKQEQLTLSSMLFRSVFGTVSTGLLLYGLLARFESGWILAIAFSWVGGMIVLLAFTSQKVKKKRPVYY